MRLSDSREKNQGLETMQISPTKDVIIDCPENQHESMSGLQDSWLPITESRNGNIYKSSFHLLSSGIGFQALLLPFAFISLGWTWGIICLSMAFLWQLYTLWLLIQLNESSSGTRYSRYLHLAIASFGVKMGKLLCIFPVMYLSGGTCVMLIITGGNTMELFLQTLTGSGLSPLNRGICFLLFVSIAISVAQLPNLNSIAGISLVGAITAIVYCTLIWVLSIYKGKLDGVSSDPISTTGTEDGDRACATLNAIGIIVFTFRGHNLVLEIMGTMPSTQKHTAQKKVMWRGATLSYIVVASCIYPLAIVGYWAYGNLMLANGVLSTFSEFHGNSTSKVVKGVLYLVVLINCLCQFQVYAMQVFDNLESIYTRTKNQRCPTWLRSGIRVFFGGFALFVALAIPFLAKLAPLIGSIALPLTFVYPCFMWIAIKKPCKYGAMWCLNLGVGCVGMVLSVVLFGAAIWNLVNSGLHANFFNP